MSIGKKKKFKLAAFTILPVILTIAVFLPAFLITSSGAAAAPATNWQKLAGYMQGFVSGQYPKSDDQADGETGFVVTAQALKTRIDPNGDNTFLGEGDDAANVPVLVDVYDNSPYIPGTASDLHFTYNSSGNTAASTKNAGSLAAEVAKHKAAGFSTDIIVYCLTGHTESPVAMAYGAMSQAGFFGDIKPKVYDLKWGRAGWNTNAAAPAGNGWGAPSPGYTQARGYTSTVATGSTDGVFPSQTNCSGSTPDSEMVRCTADWALDSNKGNIGAGLLPWASSADGSYLPVDIRNTINKTEATGAGTGDAGAAGAYAINAPLPSLFDSANNYKYLDELDNTKTNVFASRTQHTAGMAAMGAKMLGYNATFAKWGLPRWNNSGMPDEQYPANAPNYGTTTTFDTTPPSVSGVAAATKPTSAGITWTTDKPATSVVEYGTSSGGPYTPVTSGCDQGGTAEPCTILRASHSLTLTGLTGNTTYYYKVTSYDGMANKSADSGEMSFRTSVDDKVPPSVTNVSGDDYFINANYSDPAPSSGIDEASVVVTVNGIPANTCTAIGSPSGAIKCSTPTGLAKGSGVKNNTTVTIKDNAGNLGTGTGKTTILGTRALLSKGEKAPPVTTDNAPPDWQKDNFTVALMCDDGPANSASSGCYQTTFTVDGGASQTGNAVKIQYEGDHLISYSSVDNNGNPESPAKTAHAKLDKSPPHVTGTSPKSGGSIDNDGSAAVAVYFADNLSGVDPASPGSWLKIDGQQGSCAKADTAITCSAADLPPGAHEMEWQLTDRAGNIASSSQRFHVARSYYWTWYDSKYMRDWVLMSAPAGLSPSMNFGLNVAGKPMPLSQAGIVPGGNTINAIYPGLMGGPVKVSSMTGDKAIVSQRSLMGNSFEEVLGTDKEKLSDHFYWTWYDMKSAGYKNWILISNPSTTGTVHAKISFTNLDNGQPVVAENDIAPGANWNPTFPGMMGGPVEVTSTNGKVMASQRVLSGGGTAFNEVPGVPAQELSDTYHWTWYDMQSPEARNWVLIANPQGAAPIWYQIKIGGVQVAAGGPINGGQDVTPTFPGRMGGPVDVLTFSDSGRTTPAKSIASQRVTWGPSFEEVPGYADSVLRSDYQWTWYDMQSPGASNWVLVANPNDAPVNYQIKIAGSVPKGGSGIIPPHGRVTPVFPGLMNGPVEVSSSGGNVMASQRVLWNGYFNEVLGTVTN